MATRVDVSVTRGGAARRVVDHTLLRHLAIAVAAGVVLWLITLSLGSFDNIQLATMGYYFVAVAGLTVLTGLNGQISLGHGALMAIGAYTTVKLQSGPGWPLALILVVAVIVTALAGIAAGAAAARLRGPYLAGATLALAVGLPSLADKFPKFLGASNGITVPPPTVPSSLGATFPLERWQAWITILGGLATYVLLANLVRSRVGRSLRAVRDDEIAAELCGLHVPRTQVLAFVISAACAGLAGGLFVVVNNLAAPGSFPLSLSVAVLTGVILGGLGSLMGAVWGAALIVLIPTWSDDLSKAMNLSQNVQANLSIAIYGLVLIGVMLAAPRGLQGLIERIVGLGRGLRANQQRSRGPQRPGKEEKSEP